MPNGGCQEWHDRETFHWLDIANENSKSGKSTIVCGFQNPERFRKLHDKEKHLPATLFMLHASPETIRQRLLGRYPTPESVLEINRASGVPLDKFVEDNVKVIFKNKIFEIKFSDKSTWNEAVAYGKSIGIPDEQLDFPIE